MHQSSQAEAEAEAVTRPECGTYTWQTVNIAQYRKCAQQLYYKQYLGSL